MGVELAAEILYYFPQKKVIIVTRAMRLLPTLPPKCGQHAKGWIRKRGGEVLLGDEVESSGDARWVVVVVVVVVVIVMRT